VLTPELRYIANFRMIPEYLKSEAFGQSAGQKKFIRMRRADLYIC